MQTHSHRRFLLFLVLVTFAALPVFASHSWNGYHWSRPSNPIVLKLGDNVDSRWDAYLNEAEADWELSAVLSLSVIPGSTSARRCNPDTGEIEVCNARYGNNGWLGIAGIWASGSHITKGYTKLNDSYFDTAQYNTPAWRRLVTCQEIGHDFGLDHQDENFSNTNLGTCMDYTNSPDGSGGYGLSNEHPNQHDRDQLASDYNHSDALAPIVFDSAMTSLSRSRMVDGLMQSNDQWGTPIRYDGLGRPDLFVLSLGRNAAGEEEKLFTHIFWAPFDIEDRPGHGSDQ